MGISHLLCLLCSPGVQTDTQESPGLFLHGPEESVGQSDREAGEKKQIDAHSPLRRILQRCTVMAQAATADDSHTTVLREITGVLFTRARPSVEKVGRHPTVHIPALPGAAPPPSPQNTQPLLHWRPLETDL